MSSNRPKRIPLAQLEEIARVTTRKALEGYLIPDEFHENLTVGTAFEGDERIFELYVAAEKPEDAISISSVSVNSFTGEASAVEVYLEKIDGTAEIITSSKQIGFSELNLELQLKILENELNSADVSKSESAAYRLSEIADTRVLYILVKALKNDNAHVRKFAAYVIREFRLDITSARPDLIEAFNDSDDHVRAEIIAAIAGHSSLDDETVTKILMEALKDRYQSVRRFAARSLGSRKGMENFILNALLDALNDPAINVRETAVEALGRLGNPAALPALELMRQSYVGKIPEGVGMDGIVATAINRIKNSR